MSSEKIPNKKKETSQKSQVSQKPEKIYNNPRFTKHPDAIGSDLMKIIVRSPMEAYVFWKYSIESLNRLVKELAAPSTDALLFRLCVTYKNSLGDKETDWYELLPFSESYYCKFKYPVYELEASVIANYIQSERQVLHFQVVNLPPETESFQLDKSWIHPKWVDQGLVSIDAQGEYFFNPNATGEFYFHPQSQLKINNPSSHSQGQIL
jgi:hypothetical protein